MKKPRLERSPKINNANAQPQMMLTSGVRQVAPAAGRRSSVVTAICFPRSNRRPEFPGLQRYGELMHLHENPKGVSEKNYGRRAALQNRREQFGHGNECNFLRAVIPPSTSSRP